LTKIAAGHGYATVSRPRRHELTRDLIAATERAHARCASDGIIDPEEIKRRVEAARVAIRQRYAPRR